MTRDEVRKLADLAGWTPTALAMATEAEWARLEAFAGLIHGYVVHEEREACAKVCDQRKDQSRNHLVRSGLAVAALDIRNRCAA